MSMQIHRDPFSGLGRLADYPSGRLHSSGGAPRQAGAAIADGAIDGAVNSPEGNAAQGFQAQFGELAKNQEKFHSTMKQVFGARYDATKAEQFRQMALKGNFSFLPPVQFVSRETLQGGNGAYNQAEGVIYLADDLKRNPSLMQQTFVEEAGHHLDAQLNTGDTVGDEGEMFRRVMAGEKLSAADIAAIRAEDDKGTITVNGKEVQVEFWSWNPIKAIKKAVKKVVGGVKKAAKAVASAIGSAASAVGNAVKKVASKVIKPVVNAVGAAIKGVGNGLLEVGKGVVNAGKNLFEGVTQGIGGFVSNLVRGNFTDAFRALVRGADKAIFGTAGSLANGLINGAEKALDGASRLLGPVGKQLRKHVIPRLVDITRQGYNTASEALRDIARFAAEAPIGVAKDLGKAAKLLFKGDIGGAFSQLGATGRNLLFRAGGTLFDVGARTAQGLADMGQVAIGAAPPSRGLTGEEIALAREVYGDSIDYSQVRIKYGGPLNADLDGKRPRVIGSYIYFPAEDAGKALKNGKVLTEYGKEFLHEVGHIWHSQNGGGDYIHQAAHAQEYGDGYDYGKAINENKSFREMSPEQQAQYLSHKLGPILASDGPADQNLIAAYHAGGLKYDELLYALDALNHVRRGSGTPEGIFA